MPPSPGIHETLTEAIRAAYRSGQEDEALEPIVKVDSSGMPVGKISDGDSLIFYDIRGEREVELTESLIDPRFSHFPSKSLISISSPSSNTPRPSTLRSLFRRRSTLKTR